MAIVTKRYNDSEKLELTEQFKENIFVFEAIAVPEALHYSGLLTKFRILLDGESVPEKSFIFNQKRRNNRYN